MTDNRFLSYDQLDPSVTVVGTEIEGCIVAHSFNDIDGKHGKSWAGAAGNPVYFHPDLGWVKAATGQVA